jgi:hypothetical protein
MVERVIDALLSWNTVDMADVERARARFDKDA